MSPKSVVGNLSVLVSPSVLNSSRGNPGTNHETTTIREMMREKRRESWTALAERRDEHHDDDSKQWRGFIPCSSSKALLPCTW